MKNEEEIWKCFGKNQKHKVYQEPSPIIRIKNVYFYFDLYLEI